MVCYWDKKLKKRLHVLEVDIITIKKDIDLMFLAQRMHFLQDVFEITAVALVSLINNYYINELNLFWDTLNNKKEKYIENIENINRNNESKSMKILRKKWL